MAFNGTWVLTTLNQTSDTIYGKEVRYGVTIAGTITIDAQWSLDGGKTWRTVASYTATDNGKVFDTGGLPFRLLVSAVSGGSATCEAVGRND